METSLKLFVPLGTQKFQFSRLVIALNKLVEEKKYAPSEILMQSSLYEVQPLFQHKTLISLADFEHSIRQAEVVVTHSGVNTIITCMKMNKPLVIVPRLKEFGEHVDNHQLEIAELMEVKFKVLVIRNMDELSNAIEQAKSHKYLPWISNSDDLKKKLREIL